MFNTINEAINDLKQGKIIIVCDDENRENEGDFVAIAEYVTPEMVNFIITHGRGLLCTPIDTNIAAQLELNPMVADNTDNFGTAFTASIDHINTSTGISAFDRYTTIKELTNHGSQSTDFRRPGHIFPLVAKDNGVLVRPGHTEAVIDLAKLCGCKPVGILCEIINADGSMARRDELLLIAKQFDLKIITIKDLIHYRKKHDQLIIREVEAKLPTKFGNFNILGYTNCLNTEEIAVITKGDIHKAPPFVRIHSECLTGDVFHSLRCDCGEQLDQAMQYIEQEQAGVIIYLRQEGRGIGLINKLQAYKLQQAGMDTFDANVELGFAPDMREFFLAAQILKDLGIHTIKLATNNPEKIREIESYGIKIAQRIAIKTTVHPENHSYLQTKSEKFGHLL